MKKSMRALALVLVISLFSGLAPVYAANDKIAASMKLETTQGTVTMKNASGKSLKIKDETKLYSGYSISTKAKSYAWISLDSNVLIKLDASTTVTIKKNKKKLEVMLDKGNIFFNVSRPLEKDESLNIRTSSMSTGIRGTSGLMSVQQSVKTVVDSSGKSVLAFTSASNITVYEGTVSLSYAHPGEQADGSASVRQISGGFSAGVVKSTTGGSSSSLPKTTLNADVKAVSIKEQLAQTGFVAIEVAADSALCEKIVSHNPSVTEHDLAFIAKQAPQQLAKDEATAEILANEEAEAVQMIQDSVLEQADKQKKESGGTSGAISPVFPENPASPPDPTPAPTMYTATFLLPNGNPFGIQTVNSGGLLQCPLLRPTEDGAWQLNGKNYDFSSPVSRNITLKWASIDD